MFWDGSGSLLSIQNHQVELLLLPAFLPSYRKVIRKMNVGRFFGRDFCHSDEVPRAGRG